LRTLSIKRPGRNIAEVSMAWGNRADNHQPNNLGLSCGEYLLVWTWRRVVTGLSDCPLIAREFVQICGDDAAEVLATFCTFLQALAYTARRQLRFGYPGYPDNR
jgi:hypothetical protein